MTKLRDPFAATPIHNGDMPITLYEVDTQPGSRFALDRLMHDAIAFCIDPTRDLWIAYESDCELQRQTGEMRGWFRLELTSDDAKLGQLGAWAGAHFPVARLVTDAGSGEAPVPAVGYRTTNYRRDALRKRGGYAMQSSRADFVALCALLARARSPDLPANWEALAMNRFKMADMLYEEVTAQRQEIEAEDDPATIAAAPSLEGPGNKGAAA
jgi:hypothetical protein